MVADAQDPLDDAPGILKGVFNFVSREIGSFVSAATGSTIPASSSTSTSSKQGRSKRARDAPYTSKRRAAKQPKASSSSRLHSRPLPPQRADRSDSPSLNQPSSHAQPIRAIPRHLTTMPGSLFPRSPSLMPGGAEPEPFHFRIPHIPDLHTPSRARPRTPRSPTSSPQQTSKRTSSTDADDESEEIHTESPLQPPATPSSSGTKASASDAPRTPRLPSPRQSPVSTKLKNLSPQLSTPRCTEPTSSMEDKAPRIPYEAKGKGRAQEPQSRSPSPPMELSELHVRGKEDELIAAREQQRRNARRREAREVSLVPDSETELERKRDKQRIKMLEAEIAQLRAELHKRSAVSQSERSIPPPPPPLPPPPPAGIRIPIESGTTQPETLFASARAALKPAGTPVEAPINPVVFGGKRKGQPTVGVPPEKMAAFLSEMKTVRLRKVRSVLPPPATTSRLNMSFDSATLHLHNAIPTSGLRLTSSISGPIRPPPNSGLEWRIGEKRKRDPRSELQEALRKSKRRSLGIPSGDVYQRDHPPTLPPNNQSTVRAQPSFSTDHETTTATPSLCSDVGRDDDTSLTSPEDLLPSPPPVEPVTTTPQGHPYGIPLPTHKREANMAWSQTRPTTLTPEPPANSVFSKRPPMSPLPQHPTPRRPKPPSRTQRIISHSAGLGIQDLTSYSDSTPDVDISRSLEAELRAAQERRSSVTDEDFDAESGVFAGVGMGSNTRGFLAHGGAGGIPVFMGEGYVDNAEPTRPDIYKARRSCSRRGSSVPTQRSRPI